MPAWRRVRTAAALADAGSGIGQDGLVADSRRPAVGVDALAAWCERWLGAPPVAQLFEAGYLSLVQGLRLADGRQVVVKVRSRGSRLAGCAIVHRALWTAGLACPEPLVDLQPLDGYAATADEIASMQHILAESLQAGAVGLSSGLTYTPGMYADTEELVALCAIVAERGGYYSPHHRSYGAGALEAYAEMVDVSRRSGCALHLAHATMNFDVNRGRAGELLALVDAGLDDGVDITLDSYPYLPGATYLAALLPSWSMAGGSEQTLQRLRDASTRDRLRYEIEEVGSDGCHGVPVDWETIEVNGVRREHNTRLVGHSVAESARRAGTSPAELYFDLLVDEELGTSCLMHVGDEDNVRAIMRHRVHTVGSDGLLVGTKPHPRAWGTFPRYLGHYVRELGVLPLEDAVHHMTGRPARRLRLRNRGTIAVGSAADLVLFDPSTIRDRASFDDPRQPPAGIPYVFVNGVAVIDDGRRTGARPGHAIRAGRDATR